jgi:alkylated DNA repair dioxygenase AlkB
MSATLIQSEKSTLVVHNLDEEDIQLCEDCVREEFTDLAYDSDIKVWGKMCKQRRGVGFYSDESVGYNYSNTKTPAMPLKPKSKLLLSNINSKFNGKFNGILVNHYRNGKETIGKHSDDEKGLDENCGVFIISVGTPRKLRFRDKETGKIVLDVMTEPGKIIQMQGDFQKEYTHEIPVESKVEGERYSLTFRYHIN